MQVKLKFPLSAKFALPKLPPQNKKFLIIFLVLLAIVLLAFYNNRSVLLTNNKRSKFVDILNTPSTPVPTPTPTPTPRPLTFAEMNAMYGPCVTLPVLMYHHIQTPESALSKKQTGLTVFTDVFKSQMQYLKDKNYNVLTMNDLINFFDNGTAIPKHSVLLTFDDGYEDFYTDAYPILSSLGFHGTMFIPTGLMENPDYLLWDQISGMNGLVLFANHTWSHKNVGASGNAMQYEISTADTQLSNRGLNVPKVFAYPYGLDTKAAEAFLSGLDYKLAFSTRAGNVQCKKQRFDLPRIRIGSTSLSYYGF